LDAERSLAQLLVAVILAARELIRLVQVLREAEHDASRVWVMRTTDLVTWKNDMEFWRSKEKGKQDLKVALAKNPVMKLEQVDVIFELNPLSNGDGNAAAVAVAATARPLLVVDPASVLVPELVPVPVLFGGVIVAVVVIAFDTLETSSFVSAAASVLRWRLSALKMSEGESTDEGFLERDAMAWSGLK